MYLTNRFAKIITCLTTTPFPSAVTLIGIDCGCGASELVVVASGTASGFGGRSLFGLFLLFSSGFLLEDGRFNLVGVACGCFLGGGGARLVGFSFGSLLGLGLGSRYPIMENTMRPFSQHI